MEKQVLTYVLHACIYTMSGEKDPIFERAPSTFGPISCSMCVPSLATGVQLRSTASLKRYAYLSTALC